MARRKLDAVRRRPALHAEAAAERRLLRRPPVHRRRRGVFVRGGLRREDRQQPGRFAAGRRQEARRSPPSIRSPSSSRSPSRSRPGLRLLDNLPILPRTSSRRRSRPARSRSAWGLSTPPSEIVGLGPFVLARVRARPAAGVRAQPALLPQGRQTAAPLPYLDRVIVEIVPDQNAELLRLEAGQIDMTISEMPPEAYAPLKRAADAGRVKLLDLGVGARRRQPLVQPEAGRVRRRSARGVAAARRAAPGDLAGGRSPAVRRHGVPRRRPCRCSARSRRRTRSGTGRACRRRRTIRRRAKALLASIGLTDRNGDGMLEDARNRPARFTLLTQKGRPALERGAAVIRDELKKIGLVVDVVALDGNALIERFLSGASTTRSTFSVDTTDTDPALNPDFWFSSGSAHVWNIGAEDAGDRRGSGDRRADGAADRVARRGGAQAAVRRGAEDLRRAPAGRLFRRAAHLRRRRRRASTNLTPARARGRSCCGRRTRVAVTP